jgi:hypothetical protein
MAEHRGQVRAWLRAVAASRAAVACGDDERD